MGNNRGKPNPAFKKAVSDLIKKSKNDTLTYQDFLKVLGLCEDKIMLSEGYHGRYLFYSFKECMYFYAKKFLKQEEITELWRLYEEKNYLLSSQMEREGLDHIKNEKLRLASLSPEERAVEEAESRKKQEVFIALLQRRGQVRH